jgi:hypothetical protein
MEISSPRKGVYSMAHVAKYSKATVGHLAKHFERAKDENGDYVKFSNISIDTSKSHLNYNLATHQTKKQGQFIKERCEQVRCMNRKDVNVMCDWVVTAPQTLTAGEYEVFFKATYKFLTERYGLSNVISAYVHMDEVQPHMHFAFVPITKDKKKGDLKVSAKEVVNRIDLKTFHPDLSDVMKKIFNRDIGILNEATKDGNMAITDLKRKSAVKEVEKYAKMEVDLEKVNIDWKTTPFSNKVKVDLDDLIKLEEQAKAYITNKPILDNALKMQEKHEKEKAELWNELYTRLEHTRNLEKRTQDLYDEQKDINSVLFTERLINSSLKRVISDKDTEILKLNKKISNEEFQSIQEKKQLSIEHTREIQSLKNCYAEQVKNLSNQYEKLKMREKELVDKYNNLLSQKKSLYAQNQKLTENIHKLQEQALNAEKSYKEKVKTLESHQESLNKEISLFKKALKFPENLKFDEIRKALEEKGLIEPERTYTRSRGMSR